MMHEEIFSPEEKKISRFMYVMCHPARVAIMIRLAQRNQCIEGEILKDLSLSDAVVAKHLYALQQAGLIKGSTTAQKRYYCINWDSFWEFSVLFDTVFKDFQQRANGLECKRNKAAVIGRKHTNLH